MAVRRCQSGSRVAAVLPMALQLLLLVVLLCSTATAAAGDDRTVGGGGQGYQVWWSPGPGEGACCCGRRAPLLRVGTPLGTCRMAGKTGA